MKKVIFLILISLPIFAGLGMKMKARILKHSEDKKLFTLNKGHEDGLKSAYHAYFYSDEKKLFRAQIIKISPSRSIWQIYRPHDIAPIDDNYALILEVVSPVKKID